MLEVDEAVNRKPPMAANTDGIAVPDRVHISVCPLSSSLCENAG